MKNVHIVPHVHWDREWYFTTEESRILLVNNMAEIMDMLEKNPAYPYYVLDGQTAILEDYFSVCPEQIERVKKLVKAGKLIIGPWYTQTDEMVVGAESITRNLLYGTKDSKLLGGYMEIGYLPDSFGQSGQMPQILNEFDIHRAIFWRGASERKGSSKTEFYWEGLDGSSVLTQMLPLGYAIGKYLPEDKKQLKERMDKYFAVLDKGGTTAEELIPNGHDQMPIQKNIFQVMDVLRELYPERRFFLSRYENIFAVLEKETALPKITGELLDGKYSRVHRSIYSTRMDVKASNTRIENKLTNLLEPLASLAYHLGFTYHHGLIEAIWKEILKNHAHDSMGCCCSDAVHAEILGRFVNAEERVDRLIQFYMRKISSGIESPDNFDQVVVFNLLPFKREDVVFTQVMTKEKHFELIDGRGERVEYEIMSVEEVDPGLIDRQIVHYGNYEPFYKFTIKFKDTFPAMGYQTYFVTPVDVNQPVTSKVVSVIESDIFQVVANPNGTITITDKRNGRTYKDVFSLADCGDDGDEYDFSPVAGETERFSKNDISKADIKICQDRFSSRISIGYEWHLPKNLTSRKAQKNDGVVKVLLDIELVKEQSIFKVHVTLDNYCEDHRIRLIIPTDIASEQSFADTQFGLIKRETEDEALKYWEEEKWDERPDSIYPFLSHVSLSDLARTVSLMTNSSREYEVIGQKKDCLAITLFRSVGYLGKDNLLRRPGRPSGIKLATPDAQMLKTLQLSFGLYIADQDYAAASVAQVAKVFLTPLITYNQIPYQAMKLNQEDIQTPQKMSLFEQKNNQLILSTVKKAEASDILLARFYNPSYEAEQLLLEGSSSMDRYTLAEKKVTENYDGEVGRNQVVTVRVK